MVTNTAITQDTRASSNSLETESVADSTYSTHSKDQSTSMSPSDFKSISVVPVLSRILERLVVSQFIYPALVKPPMDLLIQDQFAFRPSGFTTAALIHLLQQITNMLQQHEYVIIVSIDFTKAFDRVSHHMLSHKLLQLDMTDHVYNWLVDYFQDRGHSTHFADAASLVAWINASIIQGSFLCSGGFQPPPQT